MILAEETKEKAVLRFKGQPLVRSGNMLYLGEMSDPFVVVIQISSTRTLGSLELADRVAVQLWNTDPELRPRDRVVKKAEKRGLYNAVDIGAVWLARALEKGV